MSKNNSQNPGTDKKKYAQPEPGSDKNKQKVAEHLATYTHTPARKSIPLTTGKIEGIPVSEDVWRFAVVNELIPHLKTAIKLVYKIFHCVGKIHLTYDIDPEINDESWISLRVKVSGEKNDLLNEQSAYTKSIVQMIPIDTLPLIRLMLGAI